MMKHDSPEENDRVKGDSSDDNVTIKTCTKGMTSDGRVMVTNYNVRELGEFAMNIDVARHRYPYCIVWTPIPVLSWFFPFIGHMSICTSGGVKRDFTSSYSVTVDLMTFGIPTKYLQLDPRNISADVDWDTAIREACEIYRTKQHVIYYENCHSHVGKALSIMNYNGSKDWNMVKMALFFSWHSKFTNLNGFLKTWVPFFVFLSIVIVTVILILNRETIKSGVHDIDLKPKYFEKDFEVNGVFPEDKTILVVT